MGTPTWARLRAIGMFAIFCTPAIAGCAADQGENEESVDSVESAVVTDQTVYTDAALATGWANWSWSATTNFSSTDSLMSGSKSEIKTTVTSSWGALALAHSSGDLNVSDYASVSFDIRAPSASTITLFAEPLAGGSGSPSVAVSATTSWTHQTIAVTSLTKTATFGKLDFTSATSGQTFYIDNVKVMAKAAATTPPPAPSPPPPTSSTYPTAPITVQKANVVMLTASTGPYYFYVPSSYDATHNTPTKVLLWMHGCGGNANGDAWEVSPGGTQDWISLSVGGRDGGCWNPNTDVPMALGALDDLKKHLNVDTHRVVIGGYSSGGDMAYRTAFYNASRFAGLIAENTSPFRDTGSTQQASLAAASRKFPIVHLAHLQDTEYPIAGVRTETDAVKAAGFPLTRIERNGTHWDADNGAYGTNYDMHTYLLPYLDAGWTSP